MVGGRHFLSAKIRNSTTTTPSTTGLSTTTWLLPRGLFLNHACLVSSRPLHAIPQTHVRTRTVRNNPQATSCAMRPVVCKACNNKVVASALARHELETCPMRMVECEQGCGQEVPVSGLARHLSKVREMVCLLRLGVWLLRVRRAAYTHIEYKTPFFPLTSVVTTAFTPCLRQGWHFC